MVTEICLLFDTKGMTYTMQVNANTKHNNERNLSQKENKEKT
jgi:hypothetical protein